MPATESPLRRARTKIVATVGPATSDVAALRELIDAGVDVFRINTAHGDRDEHDRHVQNIRAAVGEVGRPVGILVDLGGPKIRLGQLAQEPYECVEGEHLKLVRGEQTSNSDELVTDYPTLIEELAEGDRVMLADGTVSLLVVGKQRDHAVLCVMQGGEVRKRQGVNLPGARLSVQTPTEQDLQHAHWAAEQEVDFVGLSFVRSAMEVRRLKNELAEHGSGAMVIAKIEKPEAVAHLEEIVAEADAVMVARGDLGVEIDVADIAAVQKQIIAACTRQRKPVIVATQMLESMTQSRHPTRAEATDVANAILDGADACMLSGETAIGEHPRDTVAMMNRIALATEPLLKDAPHRRPTNLQAGNLRPVALAVVFAAAEVARMLKAKLVVVASRSGATAIAKAKQRDFIPTVGVSSSEKTLRQMCLLWGITPLPDAPVDDIVALARFVDDWGKDEGTLTTGDHVVHISGTGVLEETHDQIVVHDVE